MLNTDAHSAQIKNKMTKEQFVKNNTGFSEQDLSHELLGKMYDKIITNEIKMETEASVFVNTEKKGFLTKQGGRIKTWKKRFFILSDGCLYYFKHEVCISPTFSLLFLMELSADWCFYSS
jgi:cytohesin